MSWEKPQGVEQSQMKSPTSVMEQVHAAGQTGQNLLYANLLCRKSSEVPVSNSNTSTWVHQQCVPDQTNALGCIGKTVASRLGQVILAFSLCLWDHAWRTVSCFGLLVQDRQGHTEANPTQGHQDGQGTGALDTWEAEKTFCLFLGRELGGILSGCTIKKASCNIKFLLNMSKQNLPWGWLDIGIRHSENGIYHSWRCLNLTWARTWAPCSSRIYLIQEVSLKTFRGPVQSPWVCGSSSTTIYPLKSMSNYPRSFSTHWDVFSGLISNFTFSVSHFPFFHFPSYFSSKMGFYSLVHPDQRTDIVQTAIANLPEAPVLQTHL